MNDYKYDQVKLNYIERNMDHYTHMRKQAGARKAPDGSIKAPHISDFSITPFLHRTHRNETGDPIGFDMDMMHLPYTGLLGATTETSTPSTGTNGTNNIYSTILGFVYGMQWSTKGP